MNQAEQSRRYCSSCGAEFITRIERCPRDGAAIVELSADPLIGNVLGGRYEFVERVGEGGMGRVYRAVHKELDRSFAVKVLVGELGGDDEVVERFRREARALSRLSHRGVVSVVDFGTDDNGLLYLVVDYISGRVLRTVLEPGPITTAQAVHIARQIASALRHAHGRGIVHRDLKPENIMLVDDDGDHDAVRVLDFGIAKIVTEEETSSMRLTTDGVMMGTPAYMSPEQARGTDIDSSTDLYSLGVILFEMLMGRLPFGGNSAIEVLSQHLSTPAPPVDKSGVPGQLSDLVAKLLSKSPSDRPVSAEAVIRILDGVAAANPVHSNIVTARGHRPSSPPPPSPATLAVEATQPAVSEGSRDDHVKVARPVVKVTPKSADKTSSEPSRPPSVAHKVSGSPRARNAALLAALVLTSFAALLALVRPWSGANPAAPNSALGSPTTARSPGPPSPTVVQLKISDLGATPQAAPPTKPTVETVPNTPKKQPPEDKTHQSPTKGRQKTRLAAQRTKKQKPSRLALTHAELTQVLEAVGDKIRAQRIILGEVDAAILEKTWLNLSSELLDLGLETKARQTYAHKMRLLEGHLAQLLRQKHDVANHE